MKYYAHLSSQTRSSTQFKKFILFLIFISALNYCNAQTVVWDGSADADWFNTNNWSTNAIPTANDVAIINPTGATFLPEIDATGAVAKAVVLQANATLLITANGDLTIDAQNTEAYGIDNSGTVTNDGIIDIQNSTSNGIQNWNTFTNNGNLDISNTGDHGMYNQTMFTNSGDINITNVVNRGISSVNTFQNNSCSYITVDAEILGNSGFTNDGIVISSYSGASTIENNNGYVQNTNGGIFSFTNFNGYYSSNVDDFMWTGCNNSNNPTVADNWHNRTAPSNPNDRLHFTTGIAVVNSDLSPLFIYIYENATLLNGPGDHSIVVDGQNAISDGIRIFPGGTFDNFAKVFITNTTDDAMDVRGDVVNNIFGYISIDDTSFGIFANGDGTFQNKSRIEIGKNIGITTFAVWTVGNASFTNDNCASLLVHSDNRIIDGNDMIINNGTIMDNSSDVSNVDQNNGTIYDLNGGTFNINSGNAPINMLPATITWTGSVDSDWNKSCNWDTNLVPTGTEHIIIPNTARAPLLDSGQLFIETNGILEIEQDGFLRIDHNGQGSAFPGLLQNKGSITNNGTLDFRNSPGYGIENLGGDITNNGYILLQEIDTDPILNLDDGMNAAMITNNGTIDVLLTSMHGIESSNGTFVNANCAYIYSDGPINGSMFTNNGAIVENASSNSTIDTNNGLVFNLNGGAFTINNGNSANTTVPAINTWNGSVNNDWFNPCNWSAEIAPTINQSLIIPDVVNDPIAHRSIDINSSQSLTINANAELLLDKTTMSNFNIQVFSDGLVTNDGTITINGFVLINNGSDFLNNGELLFNGNLTNSGPFTNNGIITLQSISPLGIFNVSSAAIFHNDVCGLIDTDGNILDLGDAEFINDGTLIERSNFNSTIFSNQGIVYNLNGGNFDITSGNPALNNFLSTYTWQGSESNDWFDPCNWDSGLVPDGNQDIVIPNQVNDPIYQGQEFETILGKTLIVDPGAELDIDP